MQTMYNEIYLHILILKFQLKWYTSTYSNFCDLLIAFRSKNHVQFQEIFILYHTCSYMYIRLHEDVNHIVKINSKIN